MLQVCISSGSQIAADAGAEIAARGGNAVDAGLAAALVSMCTDIGVMAPGASGFINIWPANGRPLVIDAYAEMPGRGLSADSFDRARKKVSFDYGGEISTVIGYGSIATPGMFAGLKLASQKYGNLSWSEIIAPALEWVERGFPLTGGAAEYLLYTHQAIFSWHPESDRILHRSDGSLLREGEIVRIPDLAASLRLLSERGAEAFYCGEIGTKIAEEIQANRGLLTAADLRAYQVYERRAITIPFGEWQIAINPPPAIGGACLAAMLLLLDNAEFRQWDSRAIGRLVKIQDAVLNYRREYLEKDGSRLLGDRVARLLHLARSGNYQNLLGSPSTIHVSSADTEGLACSITASAGYGSGVMVGGTGIWLNNSLGEIELNPQGLAKLVPGIRLISNMAPTIARHPDGTVLAIGSPGASRITTAIAQVLLHFLVRDRPLAEAITNPRLHVEIFGEQDTVAFEAGLNLDLPGFQTRPFGDLSMYFGGVQAALAKPNGQLLAIADPRRTGGVAYT